MAKIPRPPAPADLRLRIVSSLKDVSRGAWDALANGPRKTEGKTNNFKRLGADSDSKPHPPESISKATSNAATAPDSPPQDADSSPEAAPIPVEEDEANPFIAHDFLLALEESGCVGGRTGWTPLHLVLEDQNGALLGAVPTYAKTHSQGEYVFDHTFAEAYARAGGAYYPKLQVAVPFTPATGRRLLVAPGVDHTAIAAQLIGGLDELRARIDASSIHATFLSPADREAFSAAGFLLRKDQQFHFLNRGYADFDSFLDALASRKRKIIRRERREALQNGISVEWCTGASLREAHWDAFFRFYMETGSRKWGRPYLNRRFFSLIGERMADRILLILARRDGRIIAGALNLIGGTTLYGRNWGAIEEHPFLHFELCYYQAIDFALQHGLRRVEAGAQGEHKLARGYEPVETVSAHHFADAGLRRAVADYLQRETRHIDAMTDALHTLTPFRKGDRDE